MPNGKKLRRFQYCDLPTRFNIFDEGMAVDLSP
jgi:hypothetical protein